MDRTKLYYVHKLNTLGDITLWIDGVRKRKFPDWAKFLPTGNWLGYVAVNPDGAITCKPDAKPLL
jgi:hypothetical protein